MALAEPRTELRARTIRTEERIVDTVFAAKVLKVLAPATPAGEYKVETSVIAEL